MASGHVLFWGLFSWCFLGCLGKGSHPPRRHRPNTATLLTTEAAVLPARAGEGRRFCGVVSGRTQTGRQRPKSGLLSEKRGTGGAGDLRETVPSSQGAGVAAAHAGGRWCSAAHRRARCPAALFGAQRWRTQSPRHRDEWETGRGWRLFGQKGGQEWPVRRSDGSPVRFHLLWAGRAAAAGQSQRTLRKTPKIEPPRVLTSQPGISTTPRSSMGPGCSNRYR